MSGGIIPKRGTGVPATGVLADGEIGISTDLKKIYFGRGKSAAPIELSGGSSSSPIIISPYANTYTTLSKTQQKLTVHFKNLQSNKTYTLYCLTTSRKGGNQYGEWYHPENLHLGYENQLAGKYVVDKWHPTDLFQATPSWMPNSGKLQTEWTTTTDYVTINLAEWFVPMIKPVNEISGGGQANFAIYSKDSSNYIASTIGVDQNARAPRLFKFCLADEDGIIYPCQQVLRIGHIINSTTKFFLIGVGQTGVGFIERHTLYSSIV